MRQLIIIDNNFDSYQQFKSKLEEELSVEVIEINDFSKALSLINILPELDCILLNSATMGEKNVNHIEKFLHEENLSTPLFLLGQKQSNRPETFCLISSDLSNELLSQIKDQFIKNERKKSQNNIPLFIPVDLQFILLHKNFASPIDFFVRLKRGDGEYQYIKRLHAGETFNQSEIERFTKNNISSLYVQRNDYIKYLKHAVEKNSQINSSESENKIKNAYDYHLSREILALIGVDLETEEMVKKNVLQMEKSVSANTSLIHYLNLLKNTPNGFGYAHSMLIALLLSKVIAKFDWGSHQIKEKICYAAFFHDIALLDDNLVRYQSNEELNDSVDKKTLLDSELEMVNHHALNSSLILEKFETLPVGIVEIVKEHHGAKNGVGFNTTQSNSLQPLSMLFIVVEDFTHSFLKLVSPNKDNIAKIITDLETRYPRSNYRKAVHALSLIAK